MFYVLLCILAIVAFNMFLGYHIKVETTLGLIALTLYGLISGFVVTVTAMKIFL